MEDQKIDKPDKILAKHLGDMNFGLRLDEIIAQASGVLDAMRHAGVLADDDYKHINCLTVQFGGIDKENPRCEVFLED